MDATEKTRKSKGARKSDRTKDELAHALLDLLRTMPLSKISVKGVTQQAGVDRQTFYYHFTSMESLVEYICLNLLRTSFQSAADGPREAFRSLARNVDENRGILRNIVASIGRRLIKRMLYDDVYAAFTLLAETLERKQMLPTVMRDFAIEYCMVASASIMEGWIMGEIEGDPDSVADAAFDMCACCLEGIAIKADIVPQWAQRVRCRLTEPDPGKRYAQ